MNTNAQNSNEPSPGDLPALPDAFLNAYIGTARQAAEQALKSLDASINWALTTTLGILAFVIHAVVIKGNLSTVERALILAILATGFAMLVHFAIRAAKNYLNIVRFAKTEREALKHILKLDGGSLQQFRDTVHTYHISWRSPLGRLRITTKVLFEFGFLYLLGFIAVMYWFVGRGFADEKTYIGSIILLLCIIAVLIEILIFSHSPYIRDPIPDADTHSKA